MNVNLEGYDIIEYIDKEGLKTFSYRLKDKKGILRDL